MSHTFWGKTRPGESTNNGDGAQPQPSTEFESARPGVDVCRHPSSPEEKGGETQEGPKDLNPGGQISWVSKWNPSKKNTSDNTSKRKVAPFPEKGGGGYRCRFSMQSIRI